MSRPPVEVRKACIDDLEDLLLLWAGSREELSRSLRQLGGLPADQMRPRLREALAAGDPTVLLARYEGSPAGYAVLRLAPVLAIDGAALHLDQLYVLTSLRRRGVGRGLLLAATQVAERNGADQVLAGAPPGARESHRFLARLGFSPLVVRRVVATSALRRRLAGESQRRGLEDLLSRRRSLRARATRAGWPGSWASMGRAADDDAELDDVDAPGVPVVDRPLADRPLADLEHIDLASCPTDAATAGRDAEPASSSSAAPGVMVDVPAQGCPDAVADAGPARGRRVVG